MGKLNERVKMMVKFSSSSDILIVFKAKWIILYLWVWVPLNIPSKFLLIISVVFHLSPLPECTLLEGQEFISYSLPDPQSLVGKL